MIRDKKFAAAAIIGFIAAVLLFCVAMTLVSDATTTKPRKNSLGAVINDIDPNMAIVGSIIDGNIHQDADGRQGTTIRIHPKAMYALFDESIMFCGDRSDVLTTPDSAILSGNYAFTYRRQASRLIDGVACHELVGVDKIVEEKK